MAGLLAYIGAGALAGASQGAQQALTNSTQWGGWWNVQRLENQKIAWESKAKEIEYQNLANLETLVKQPYESKQKALDRATALKSAELGVEAEKRRGENAALTHAAAQLSLQQGDIGLKQYLQGQALASQELINQQNVTSREGIAAQALTSREGIAAKEVASREGIAAQDRANKLAIVNKQIEADTLKTDAQIKAKMDELGLGLDFKRWETQQQLAAKGALVHSVYHDTNGNLVAVHNDDTASPVMIDDQPVRAPKKMTDQQKILAQYYLNQIKSNNALLAKEDDPTAIDTLDQNDLVFKRQLFGLLGQKYVQPDFVNPYGRSQSTDQGTAPQGTAGAPGPGPAAPAAPAAPVAPAPLGGSLLNPVQ